MSTLILAAIVGYLWMEVHTVNVALKKKGQRFSTLYYLSENWTLILGNGLGTVLITLCAPMVILALRHFAAQWVSDPEIIATLADNVLAPMAGGLIGLLGARGVRWVFNKGNTRLNAKD